MGTAEEMSVARLVARLERLEQDKAEQANRLVTLEHELVALRQERLATIGRAAARRQVMPTSSAIEAGEQTPHGGRSSRRKMLRIALGTAAAALATGALLETQAGVAQADSTAAFSSSNFAVPAVGATGSNGAVGVAATSDSGYAVNAVSNGAGTAIHAYSNSGAALDAYSNTHTAIFAGGTSGANTTGVHAAGNGATLTAGVTAAVIADAAGSGVSGVYATSTAGNGVHALAGGITPSTLNTTAAVFAEATANGVIGIGGLYGGAFSGGLAPLHLRPSATSGPPTSSAHLVGDLMVDSLGTLWACVTAGTPGAWRQFAFV